jgi:hypothetical protein
LDESHLVMGMRKNLLIVIPAKAGIQFAFCRPSKITMDSGFRRNDGWFSA